MSYVEARQTTMWEFYTKLQYHIDKKNERIVEYQILAGIALNPHTKKPLSPQRLIRTPGATQQGDKPSLQEIMELYRNGKRIKC